MFDTQIQCEEYFNEQSIEWFLLMNEAMEEEYYEETVYDNDQLSDLLKDITDRYSELDFSDNSDIDKKVELIKDIEILIEDETKKGEGLNSKNADIRQIFVELQNIVDDMKNAL